MALLELRNVKKAFGSLIALDHINLDVNRGEVLGIVGPNGSGKTTLLNIISGFYHPTEGSIVYKGHKTQGLRPDRIAARGIVRTFQQNVVYSDCGAVENILRTSYLSCKTNLWQSFFGSKSYVKEEQDILQEAINISKTFGLDSFVDTLAGSLPHGKQRSLGMAMALAAKPDLLLLDEPLAGMDASETEAVAKNIQNIISRGVTVMMVEHNIKSVIRLCPRIIVLDFGHKIADGKPDEVLNRQDVVEAYLGVE
jgi:branched-chain amino acid transport system ATP-binding protein